MTSAVSILLNLSSSDSTAAGALATNKLFKNSFDSSSVAPSVGIRDCSDVTTVHWNEQYFSLNHGSSTVLVFHFGVIAFGLRLQEGQFFVGIVSTSSHTSIKPS